MADVGSAAGSCTEPSEEDTMSSNNQSLAQGIDYITVISSPLTVVSRSSTASANATTTFSLSSPTISQSLSTLLPASSGYYTTLLQRLDPTLPDIGFNANDIGLDPDLDPSHYRWDSLWLPQGDLSSINMFPLDQANVSGSASEPQTPNHTCIRPCEM
ncbi:hypothetical protein SERLA73DRAFT_75205 [Serpula lacrymans var. lacrymans S7.3]|uniref:Uncharacterized protein n=2 Tax=Serpula lacrymans var. lacrymans TaxID=341189 RepID=F8Q2W8_SERL3|nr:uncharacterized protein SERLADRAFT_439874 [Serpula lacrymans var. lacrymans S7.9]EGN97529.1 hypothetical protein SERLA73DRAFT_75205 [Serpula lacrymans var. lacrymans S7.3]EGO23130.1 hypothetical protein SERLADRAFT_439874 [Serpula lacrymans var. lacrymans S7.9]